MAQKRMSLADLSAIRNQVPNENLKPSRAKASKKEQSKGWNLPVGGRTPLQVVKLDDLDTISTDSHSVYSELIGWQAKLNELKDIRSLSERFREIETLWKEEKDQRTGFDKILKRLKDRREFSKDEDHQLAIKEAISKLDDQRIRTVLQATEKADDEKWQPLYDGLCQRVEWLACSVGKGETRRKAIVEADYNWRVRVGGTQGFREQLLPVMHPVYGIPYVPSSTLKGIVRAWARHNDVDDVDRQLGFLSGSEARMAAVEFLDAFPMAPSVAADVITPQWSWRGDEVSYKPEPHHMLSLNKLSLKIGLTHTSCGAESDVEAVLGWLTSALAENSLGSRGSAGYGQAYAIDNARPTLVASQYQSVYPFKLWSQGIYGAYPPKSRQGHDGLREFRPVALKGVLRYWFRVIALGLYSPQTCKSLEARLLGTIEPKAVAGAVSVQVAFSEEIDIQPHVVEGSIVIKSRHPQYLALVSKVLELMCHLGGIGRGSRRPLHWNDGFRGCYWELTETSTLPNSLTQWRNFLMEDNNSLRQLFQSVQAFDTPQSCTPGSVDYRKQGVLNEQSEIILVTAKDLKHPAAVTNWKEEGKEDKTVRGPALALLYGDPKFKGGKSPDGNPEVGGKMGTPSYVIIQSNFPSQGDPYQAVTVFGANNPHRQKFVSALTSKYGLRRVPW